MPYELAKRIGPGEFTSPASIEASTTSAGNDFLRGNERFDNFDPYSENKVARRHVQTIHRKAFNFRLRNSMR